MQRKKTRLLIQNEWKTKVKKIEKFFNNIYPVSSEYEGCRQLWVKYPNGNFKEIMFHKTSEFYKHLENFEINKNCDYYITSNSLYADRRGTENLFSVDNLVFDLDNHNSDISAYSRIRDINHFLHLLETKYCDKFPYPTAIIITGRGIQIWVHIEGLSSKLLFLWKSVVNSLCDILEQICREENTELTVDRTASCNASGLFRLPFTYNTLMNRYIDEVDVTVNNVSYRIDNLIERFNLDIKKKSNVDKKRKSEDISDDEYKNLHFKRIKFIEKYVKSHNFDVIGHRNAIIFLYYNACVQVMERSKALDKTRKLNQSFKSQYSESEFKTVIAAVDKHIYKLKVETFLEILGATEEEKQIYKEMSEYKPKIDKKERNKMIFSLAYERKTCQQIADEVGCSEKTVRTVLKDFDKSEFIAVQVKKLYTDGDKTQQEIADIFNISLRQVSRYLKG